MRGTLVICSDPRSLMREAAERFLRAVEPRHPKDRLRVALAGGSTPRGLYELLARPDYRPRIAWSQIHFFWGDERLVPHDHPDSNFRMVNETLLKRVPLPRANIHPVPVQASLENAAQVYEDTLREHFEQRHGVPAFDLVLLGLGPDGHVASLFPGAPALAEKEKLVATHTGKEHARVTLTLPVINAARRVFFLLAGQEKAEALARAVEGRGPLPAQQVAPRKGELVWLANTAAAGRLENPRVEPARKEAHP